MHDQLEEDENDRPDEPKPPRETVGALDGEKLPEGRDVLGVLPKLKLPPRGATVLRLTVVRDGMIMSATTAPAALPMTRPEPVE
jgi:hypothetical protein